jgi:hypothetical protein
MTNIVTDYGAVGDGQWACQPFTMAVGGVDLASPVAIWSPSPGSDDGKTIVVGNAGGSGPQGGSVLLATINSIDPTGKIATLSATSPVGLPIDGRTNFIVCWGTDNATPFTNYRNDFDGLTDTLTVPPGRYLIASGNFDGVFFKLRNITVNGSGASIIGGAFQLGAGAQGATATDSSRTLTALAGATSITCIVPSEASRFPVGEYALMTSSTLQYGGYPSNHFNFEYVLVTGADAGTGIVTFTPPLTKTYLDTEPDIIPLGGLDYGGPATMYHFVDNFNHIEVINDLSVVHDAQFSTRGLSFTANNCIFYSDHGPYPTMTKDCVYNNCVDRNSVSVNGAGSTINGNMEVDKYIFNFTMRNCHWAVVTCQSSNENMLMDEVVLDFTLLGNAKHMTIKNCTINNTWVPGVQYGHVEDISISDTYINTVDLSSGRRIAGGNFSGNGIQNDFTMVGNTIVIPASYLPFGITEQWWSPSAYIYFFDFLGSSTVGLFKIVSASRDTDNVYLVIERTLPGFAPGFPPTSNPSNGLNLLVHVGPKCTFKNVTGDPVAVDLCGAPSGAPMWTYTNRTYTGSIVSAGNCAIWGKIESVKIDVTKAYSGPTGVVTMQLINNYVTKISDTSLVVFTPTINLKVTGSREFTSDNGYPASWTGAQSGDTMPSAVTEPVWSGAGLLMQMVDISGEDPSTWPQFTVEMKTDQGISFFPSVIYNLMGQSWT